MHGQAGAEEALSKSWSACRLHTISLRSRHLLTLPPDHQNPTSLEHLEKPQRVVLQPSRYAVGLMKCFVRAGNFSIMRPGIQRTLPRSSHASPPEPRHAPGDSRFCMTPQQGRVVPCLRLGRGQLTSCLFVSGGGLATPRHVCYQPVSDGASRDAVPQTGAVLHFSVT